MENITLPKLEKYVVIFKGQKIYIDADNFDINGEINVHIFRNKDRRTLAVFPIAECAVILNNPNK